MNKKCFKKGCLRQPAFACECKKGVYFCKKHMGDHMLLQKTHNIELLYVILDQDEEQKMKKKTSKLISVYSEILQKVQKYSKTLIDSIISQSNKLIDEIASHSAAASRIRNSIIKSVPIDNEDLELIKNLTLTKDISSYFDSSEMIKSLELDFKQQSLKIFNKSLQDKLIFYQDQTDLNYLWLFDTKTLNSERKRFDFESAYYIGSSIQYKESVYYLAMISYPVFNTASGYSYNFCIKKIDLKSCSTEKIYSSSQLNGGPLIKHYNSLFMFSCNQSIYRLDIDKGTWINAGNMPESLTYVSASHYIDMIFMTGYSSRSIYKFNPETCTFHNFIVFDKGTNRYLFDNWIISVNDSLYEIQGSNLVQHQALQNFTNCLKIFSYFRQEKFIYFVDSNNKVYRINTRKKDVQEVKFN